MTPRRDQRATRASGMLIGGVLSLALAVAADPAPITAAGGSVGERLQQAQGRLSQTRDRERVLTDEVEGYGRRIQALETRLAPLRARSERLEGELASLRARLVRLSQSLAAERTRLAAAERALARRQALLSGRIREIYVRGAPDPVIVLMESGSLSSAIEAVELLESIAVRDADLADAVSESADETRRRRDGIIGIRADVARSEARAEQAAAEAASARSGLEEQQADLLAVRDDRRRLLGRVQGDRRQIEAEARDLERRSARLADRIRAAQGSASGPVAAVPAPATGTRFIWPVRGTLTSTFGPRWGRMHQGIDIAGASGTPIAASAAGTVIVAGWSGGYGNLVVVDHGEGVSTAYAHNSSIAVSVGQKVGQGTVLAGMGTTGNSTGVHSHFEMRINGAAVDPLGYL